jgi:Fe-S oxidoreductase
VREVEIKRAVKNCFKCTRCRASGGDLCPINKEFGIAPFAAPSIFFLADAIFDGIVKMDSAVSTVPFSCTMCGQCSKRCPAPDLHFQYEYPTKLIEGIRALFVENGAVPESINEVLRNLGTTGSMWLLPKSQRVEWEKKCNIRVPDYARERNEFLLFIGDASLIPETQNIPRSIAQLLQKAGLDFGTLKEEELDSGNEARELGETGLFEDLARQNIETFNKLSVKKIITISPHDYQAIRNDYPKLGLKAEVYHYTQIISDLMRKGKLRPHNKIAKRITYHDPCHLGRYNGIYEEPRSIIRMVPGVTLVEMSQTRDDAFCCGAGGGRMWYDPQDNRKQRISDVRVTHAKTVDADIIATACPYCLTNLQGSGNLGNIVVKDIAEIVLEATKG